MFKLHLHKWKYVPAVFENDRQERLGIAVENATRTCSVCGKTQSQDIHCLGLNPPEYVYTWVNQ